MYISEQIVEEQYFKDPGYINIYNDFLKAIRTEDYTEAQKLYINIMDSIKKGKLIYLDSTIESMKASLQNLEALTSLKSQYAGLLTKYNIVGSATIAGIVGIIGYISYNVYKRWRERSNPEVAAEKALISLKDAYSTCGKTSDPMKCKKELKKMIDKFEEIKEKNKK